MNWRPTEGRLGCLGRAVWAENTRFWRPGCDWILSRMLMRNTVQSWLSCWCLFWIIRNSLSKRRRAIFKVWQCVGGWHSARIRGRWKRDAFGLHNVCCQRRFSDRYEHSRNSLVARRLTTITASAQIASNYNILLLVDQQDRKVISMWCYKHWLFSVILDKSQIIKQGGLRVQSRRQVTNCNYC